MTAPAEQPTQTPEQHQAAELAARRRRRSVALGLVLFALVVIFYVLTIIKLGPSVFQRQL